MRLHITLDDGVVAELDRRAGPRGRSAFILAAIRAALDDEWRWDAIESSIGSIRDGGHEWDVDPAGWVHGLRFDDPPSRLMGRVLLDTTVLIDVLRGRPVAGRRVLALRRTRDVTVMCAINVEELIRGLQPSEVEAAERLLAALRTVRLGHAEGVLAGTWRREYA